MSSKIKPDQIGAQIEKILGDYSMEKVTMLDIASDKAAKKLAKLTKETAPEVTGDFAKAISSKLVKRRPVGNIYAWYVKSPFHRLTHLIVHGHALPNGGRTYANPFLKEAMDQVLPEYEQEVREIFSGK